MRILTVDIGTGTQDLRLQWLPIFWAKAQGCGKRIFFQKVAGN